MQDLLHGNASVVGRLYHRVYSGAEETLKRDCPMICGTYLPRIAANTMCKDMGPVPCFSGAEQCCANPWTYFDYNHFLTATPA